MSFLDRIQAQTATAREFFIVVRLGAEKEQEQYLSRVEKSLSDQGFAVKRYGSDDLKKLLAVYFEQKLLTDEGILLNCCKFTEAAVFDHGGSTNIVFSMDDVELDIGRLSMWRLQSHSTFGGTWLSDFVENNHIPYERSKPEAPIIGADGNVFNVLGIARNALREAGMRDEAKEMSERVLACGCYDEALAVMMEYVEPVSVDEVQEYGGWEMEM